MENAKTINCIVNSRKCTGCMACYNMCPNNAISIEEKEDGFLYPQIQQEKCINCGICIKTCPIVKKREHIRNSFCYAAQANDAVRQHSSSGGMFQIMAQYIIHQGGVVCGAGFVDGKVRHIIIDAEEELKTLRKSKYIQSDCSNIYKELKAFIESNRYVLFTGTPCQCAAVKNIYSKNDNLIVIDILCMGVPSQKLFDRYLYEEMQNDIITHIDFRDKSKYGWSPNLVLALQRNGKEELIDSAESSYYSAFLDAYSIRESCTECAFAGKERVGDITIGDFWGIEGFDINISDAKGTSLVLVNTVKGESLWNLIKEQMKSLKKFDIDIAFQSNPILKHPTVVSSKRREFLNINGEETIREKYDFLKSNRATCGIINYWWCNDNGAILTAFALQRLLQINGFSSRLINICSENQLKRSGGISSRFEQKHLYTTNPIVSKEQFNELNDSFENFIVGSDQVFRAEWVSDTWFLDFVELTHNKIAMSASFGIGSLSVDRRRKRKIKYLLSRFNSISIRELSGIEICNNFSINAQHVVDPVFLIDPQNYVDIINDKDFRRLDKKYVFGYFRDKTDDKLLQINQIASRYNLDVFIADDSTEVEEFLFMVYSAEYVLTDSYHGLCFALIFNKNFACYYNELRGNDRFDSLIQTLGINKNKFLPENKAVLATEVIKYPVDWERINSNILEQREIGTEWLINALRNPSSINKAKLKKAYWQEKVGNLGWNTKDKLLHNRITRGTYSLLKRMGRKVKHRK